MDSNSKDQLKDRLRDRKIHRLQFNLD